MAPQDTRQAVDRFIADLNRALRAAPGGLGSPLFPSADAAIAFTILGSHPGAGTYHGLDLLERGFAAGQSRMSARPQGGLFPIEYFPGDDNTMVVVARGRGETALGAPYNIWYFLYFEARHGKIIRFIEDVDSSTIYQVVHDHHVEPDSA